MSRKFKILDTKDNREMFTGLENTTATFIKACDDGLLLLDTLDGELYFAKNEVEEME